MFYKLHKRTISPALLGREVGSVNCKLEIGDDTRFRDIREAMASSVIVAHAAAQSLVSVSGVHVSHSGERAIPGLQTKTSSAIGSFRSRCLISPSCYWKERAQATTRGRVGRARAAQDDEGPTSAPPPPPPLLDKKSAAKSEAEKGQKTAIITGVISVLLGVGYLVLVQLLDTRGVNMIPPPPEAFDP